MQDLNDKATGNTITAAEWNQIPSEIQNVIEDTGQTLSAGDLDQLGKGIAAYVANGNYYIDSGAADAYALSSIGTKQVQVAYTDGMIIEFIATNTNTGASTVNVNSIGAKNIYANGAALTGGEIVSGEKYTLIYDSGNDRFNFARIIVDRIGFGGAALTHTIDIPTSGANKFRCGNVSNSSWQMALGFSSGNGLQTAIEGGDTGTAADRRITLYHHTTGARIAMNDGSGNQLVQVSSLVNENSYFKSGGNFGFGTSDIESWASTVNAFQLGDAAAILWNKTSGALHILENAYYDGAWKYRTTNKVSRYNAGGGDHVFYVAASGTADTAITWTEAFRIDNSGNMGIGTSDIESWASTFLGINLAAYGAIMQSKSASATYVLDNLYYDGAWKYRNTAPSCYSIWATGSWSVFTASSGTIDTTATVTKRFVINNDGGVTVGTGPTGGSKGAGTINTQADIYKNNSAYTNPDYAFEHYFTGKIEQFKENAGAEKYTGLKSIEEVEEYVSENYRFPGITDEGTGIFERADLVMEKLEEAYLHIIELNKRVKQLESMAQTVN